MEYKQQKGKYDFHHSFGGACATKFYTSYALCKLNMKRQKDQHRYKGTPTFLKILLLCKNRRTENGT